MELTDFNDLHVSEGLQAVRELVQACLAAEHPFPQPAAQGEPGPGADGGVLDDAPPLGEAPVTAGTQGADTPRSPSGPGGAQARGMRIPDLDEVIQNAALIYGTDTVFDCSERIIMKVSNLTQLVGRDVIKLWQASPRRRVIRKVVFDPQGRYDPAVHENLYDGMPFEADDSADMESLTQAVQPILNHIWWMADGNEEVWRWVLKWIAYPVQHPGAKMQTSVINYGLEGTGKSFLWEQVVKEMYGRYGITVGQSQLESQFNTWKSHKLFVVAEEVVSRAEKAHYKGQLKHMVTGGTHMINEKNLPEREEDNLMNFVFLSNNTQPLDLDYGDRRYLALYMGTPKPAEYYDQLGAWLAGGGVERFFQYLRKLPLGDFGPHSKPPMTEAKDGLIGLSMPSPQYFFREWSRGELGVPYSPCVNDDLFQIYVRWCERQGEYRMSQRKFSGELKRFIRQERVDIEHPDENSLRRTKRIWVPDDWQPQDPQRRVAEIGSACRLFHLEGDRYVKGV